MSTFPHERPMTIPEALDLEANEDFFNEFEAAMQSASNGAHHHATLAHYNYFFGGTQKQYVICRPLASGGNLTPWVYETSTQSYLENADWDVTRNQLDMSKVPAHAAPAAPAAPGVGCPSCGSTACGTGSFCSACGAPLLHQPPVQAGGIPGLPLPPQGGGGISVQGPPTASASIRMTGKPQDQVVIPEGLGKGDSKKQEADWIEKMLAGAEEPSKEEPTPET